MNKKELKKLIANRKETVDGLIKTVEKSKAISVSGTLYCIKQHGRVRFYIKEPNDSRLHYQSEEKETRIKSLARKTYATMLLNTAKKEQSQLSKCLDILGSETNGEDFDKADIDLVYDNLNEGIRNNVSPSRFTDEGYAQRWQEEKYYNRWMKSDYSFETPRGEKVRSKSEWMIACMLAEAGVPYRYEEIVAVSPEFKLFFHPDFTVLNKRTRKVYYWEHFGRMDDPKYIEESFMPKMNDYYNFEFLPGEKLLMTFESKHHPLDTTQVKRLIENYLF